jgi:hypothetical protein
VSRCGAASQHKRHARAAERRGRRAHVCIVMGTGIENGRDTNTPWKETAGAMARGVASSSSASAGTSAANGYAEPSEVCSAR